MEITATAHMEADPQTAWDAFHAEWVLARTIPGVESLTPAGPGAYDVVMTMGVAAIKGTYKGSVGFSQEKEPESFVMSAKGQGGPGTIGADVTVQMAPGAQGGTDITWSADAVLGGAIGGVGQRMLTGVGKRSAAKFFMDIDQAIKDGPDAGKAAPGAEAAGADGAATAAAASGGEAGVAAGQPAAPAGAVPAPLGAYPVAAAPARGGMNEFFAGAVVGAGAALLGTCIGILAGRK